MSGLIGFEKGLGSGTIFFVMMPAVAIVAALVVWRLWELFGEELISVGEISLMILLLLTVFVYLLSEWRTTTPYIAVAVYLTGFLVYVRLVEGRQRKVKLDYQQMKTSLVEVGKARVEREQKQVRAGRRAERAAAEARAEEDAEERLGMCPFCQKESLIVRGVCQGCEQKISEAGE